MRSPVRPRKVAPENTKSRGGKPPAFLLPFLRRHHQRSSGCSCLRRLLRLRDCQIQGRAAFSSAALNGPRIAAILFCRARSSVFFVLPFGLAVQHGMFGSAVGCAGAAVGCFFISHRRGVLACPVCEMIWPLRQSASTAEAHPDRPLWCCFSASRWSSTDCSVPPWAVPGPL